MLAEPTSSCAGLTHRTDVRNAASTCRASFYFRCLLFVVQVENVPYKLRPVGFDELLHHRSNARSKVVQSTLVSGDRSGRHIVPNAR